MCYCVSAHTSYPWYYDIRGNEWQVAFKKLLLEKNLVRERRKSWNGSRLNNLETEDFRDLLKVAANESIFVFDEKYYKKIVWRPRGLPLTPTLVRFFVRSLRKKTMVVSLSQRATLCKIDHRCVCNIWTQTSTTLFHKVYEH